MTRASHVFHIDALVGIGRGEPRPRTGPTESARTNRCGASSSPAASWKEKIEPDDSRERPALPKTSSASGEGVLWSRFPQLRGSWSPQRLTERFDQEAEPERS